MFPAQFRQDGENLSRARQGRLAELGKPRRPVMDLKAERSRLERELAKMRRERAIVKSHRVLCEGAAAQYALMTTLRHQ